MNQIKVLIILCALGSLMCVACQSIDKPSHMDQEAESSSKRIISLSGFLTETLYSLGHGEQIVGTDITSTYPAAVDTIPKLGHISQLNAEGILALRPDMIFVEESQLTQTKALDQLAESEIKIVSVPTSNSLYNAVHAAKVIKEHLPISEEDIAGLTQRITEDSLKLTQMLAEQSHKPRVLFIYARGAGRLMVGGNNTSASTMIEKAGGINAIQSFDNFRALTPEALIEAAPDVILMFDSGLASLDGKEGLAQITGIPQTPAYQHDQIISMDGHFLSSFGPRASEAALELASHMHSTTH